MERVGRRFAYRDHPRRRGAPVEAVEVVREGPDGTRQVLIRFLAGEREGRETWVPAGRLLVPWEEVEVFCRDEQLMLAALEASGDVFDTPPYEAAGWVFTAMAERWGAELVYCGHSASEGGLVIIEDFDNAVPKISGLRREELLDRPHAFVDRHGTYYAPFAVGEELARSFCRQYPDEIVEYIEAKDRQYLLDEARANPDYTEDNIYIRYLRSQREAFRLVREWCGKQAVDRFREVQTLRMEIDRLRGIIESLARWLENEGRAREARWLLEQMKEREDGNAPPNG